ncbi:MAG: 2'-5' RNA ligase family protein [Leptolyngbya sp. DLM2.Bin15]|nr:MAG: 2'-5' RNA ligase family protein [Leptolyngbya sp. DLM2.Bin15]
MTPSQSSHPGEARFFIALIPPPEIQDAALQIIQELSDRFQTSTAKAPPHITLYPPFLWTESDRLLETLTAIAQTQAPIDITLSGFAAFPPRVLYLHVEPTPGLMDLQTTLSQQLEQRLGIVDPVEQRRGFTPHLTVASRNVTRSTFRTAWSDLQHRRLTANFRSDRLSLLRHNRRYWQVVEDFPLIAQTGQAAQEPPISPM